MKGHQVNDSMTAHSREGVGGGRKGDEGGGDTMESDKRNIKMW